MSFNLLLNDGDILVALTKTILDKFHNIPENSDEYIELDIKIKLFFCEKGFELFKGILQLFQNRNFICGEIICRSLFEICYKYIHYKNLIELHGNEYATQEFHIGTFLYSKFKEENAAPGELKNYIEYIHTLYNKNEDIKKFKEHGFTRMSVLNLVKTYGNEEIYQIYYKLASNITHSSDFYLNNHRKNCPKYNIKYAEVVILYITKHFIAMIENINTNLNLCNVAQLSDLSIKIQNYHIQ